MPIVEIKMWSGRNIDTKRRLIEEVSRKVADVLCIEIGRIEVVLTDVPKENWGKEGKQVSALTLT